jgi:hypothetical protein
VSRHKNHFARFERQETICSSSATCMWTIPKCPSGQRVASASFSICTAAVHGDWHDAAPSPQLTRPQEFPDAHHTTPSRYRHHPYVCVIGSPNPAKLLVNCGSAIQRSSGYINLKFKPSFVFYGGSKQSMVTCLIFHRCPHEFLES